MFHKETACNLALIKHLSSSHVHACMPRRFSRVQLSATQWTVSCQAPLSMGFCRQEYWSELPFPSPGDLSDPGIKPRSPTLQADSYCLSHQGSPWIASNGNRTGLLNHHTSESQLSDKPICQKLIPQIICLLGDPVTKLSPDFGLAVAALRLSLQFLAVMSFRLC